MSSMVELILKLPDGVILSAKIPVEDIERVARRFAEEALERQRSFGKGYLANPDAPSSETWRKLAEQWAKNKEPRVQPLTVGDSMAG